MGSHLTEEPACSYLDTSAFRDHDLPHTVEAVEVGLWEARGQDGAPAFSEVATTGHWEETWGWSGSSVHLCGASVGVSPCASLRARGLS